MAGIWNIYANQGDSYDSGPIQWQRGGVGVDISTFTGACQIRTNTNSGVIQTATISSTDSTGGWFRIIFTSTQMSETPADGPGPTDYTEYFYDVQFSSTAGYVETILKGSFFVAAEVTT